MVDHRFVKYLGSSLIDFHISTDKPSWLSLRGVPLFSSQDLKPGPVIAKAFIVSEDPVIRMSKG